MSAFDVEYTYQRGFEDAMRIRRNTFASGAMALRRYTEWEYKMDLLGVDLMASEVDNLAEEMVNQLCGGDMGWGDDPVTGTNWVVVWCSAPFDQKNFSRKNQWIALNSPMDLFGFVCEMMGLGWPEVTPERWVANV